MVFGNRRIPKHLILENKYNANKRSKFGAGWIILAIAIIVTSMIVSLKTEAQPHKQKNAHCLQKNLQYNSPKKPQKNFYAHI